MHIDVACLPPICRQWNGTQFVPVPRNEADIVDGPTHFAVHDPDRGGRYGRNYFGYLYVCPWPTRRLVREVTILESLLPRLFAAFDEGVLTHKERWSEVADFLPLYDDRTEHFDADGT